MSETKELTARQRQAIESRHRLMSAAEELFSERGYQETTVQDICSRAGLSVGVFYHYFSSKQDALLAILHSKTDELMELIDAESTAKTHIEALLEVFGYVCRQQISGSFATVCSAFTPSPSKRIGLDPSLYNFVYNIVRSAQETGELTGELDASVITTDLLASSRGYVFYWCERGGEFDVCTEQQAYLKRLLRAYIGPNGTL